MPFSKGDPNINRKGRLTSQVSAIRKVILKRLGQKRDGRRAVDALIDKLTRMALAGNLEAAKLLIAYAYGKPATLVDAVLMQERPIFAPPELWRQDTPEGKREAEQRERISGKASL